LDKKAAWLSALQRISGFLARNNVKCSLALFSQSQPSYLRLCNGMKGDTLPISKTIKNYVNKTYLQVMEIYVWYEDDTRHAQPQH